MIHSRRQVNTYSEHYGGYGNESSATATAVLEKPSEVVIQSSAEPEPAAVSAPVMEDMSILRTVSSETAATVDAKPAPAEAPIYTSAPTVKPIALPERPVRERKPLDREDLMPSIRTQAFAREAERTEAETPARTRAKKSLAPKTKILLAVYVAVALVLAIAVIATGISISQTSAQADVIAQSIAQKQMTIVEQETRIAELTNENTIRSSAEKNGMVTSSHTDVTVSGVEKVGYEKPEVHTNSFDRFCDWWSNVAN